MFSFYFCSYKVKRLYGLVVEVFPFSSPLIIKTLINDFKRKPPPSYVSDQRNGNVYSIFSGTLSADESLKTNDARWPTSKGGRPPPYVSDQRNENVYSIFSGTESWWKPTKWPTSKGSRPTIRKWSTREFHFTFAVVLISGIVSQYQSLLYSYYRTGLRPLYTTESFGVWSIVWCIAVEYNNG